jgi:hypothetical protein
MAKFAEDARFESSGCSFLPQCGLFVDFSGNECMEINEYSGNFCRSGCLISPAHGLLFPVKQQPFQSV